jgi:glycosyltransferase involved in cell wall biosynthesis
VKHGPAERPAQRVRAKGRVVLLHYTAQPVVGGVEVVLAGHAARLAEAGYEVTVVAGRGRSPDARVRQAAIPIADSLHPRVRAARLELDRGVIPRGFDALVADATAALDGAVATAEVLIAHNVASLPMNLALTAALRTVADRRAGPHVVLWHHDVAAAMDTYRHQLHAGWPWDLVRTAWPETTSVAISAARADAYARTTGLAPDLIRVIPNGLDRADVVGMHPSTIRLLRDRSLERAAPLLLAPVRLNPRKNVELAIAVTAALRTWMGDVALVVTGARDPHDPGSGEYLLRLGSLSRALGVEDAVHIVSEWTGAPPSDRLVRDLYGLADAVLLPSRDEGFGLPVLEASIRRLPVFCANVPALLEVAGQDATVFPADAPAAEIAVLIRDRLADDPVYRAAVRARTEYDAGSIFETAIEPLVASLVSAARTA